jgi:hypothetical protein
MRISPGPSLLGFLFLLLSLTPSATPQSTLTTPTLVILNVTVINPAGSSVQPDKAVVVAGNYIAAVSDAAHFQIPTHARVIDGTGQFLIPGLWDMHVHCAFGDWFPGGRNVILPLLIANGVTGIRDMGGDISVLLAWRNQIADGKIIGPRMVISGPMLDGYLPDGKSLASPVPFRLPRPQKLGPPSTRSKRSVWISSKLSP